MIIDNYDSFVFNIARYFHNLGEKTEVVRNDAVTVCDLVGFKPRALVISPGPCTPFEAGISIPLVRELSGRVPILGICLGHQCIGTVFGGRVARARRPMHGRPSYVVHRGHGLFDELPSPLRVGRYHSLVELDETCAPQLTVIATSEEARLWHSHIGTTDLWHAIPSGIDTYRTRAHAPCQLLAVSRDLPTGDRRVLTRELWISLVDLG